MKGRVKKKHQLYIGEYNAVKTHSMTIRRHFKTAYKTSFYIRYKTYIINLMRICSPECFYDKRNIKRAYHTFLKNANFHHDPRPMIKSMIDKETYLSDKTVLYWLDQCFDNSNE